MFSKSLAIGALAAGCVAAAAGGAYVAARHNAGSEPTVAGPATLVESSTPGQAAGVPKPVAETEAVVSSPAAPKPETEASADVPAVTKKSAPKPVSEKAPKATRPSARQQPSTVARTQAPSSAPAHSTSSPRPESTPAASREAREPIAEAPAPASVPPVASPRTEVEPQPATEVVQSRPQLEEIVVPASSVIGLRVETPLSTEKSRVEDRVEARVTRDVMVDDRVAIPSGARAIGSVTLVERGGKMKDRARLGVRFHTLVLADGTELPINTEAIYREGDSPSGESARKIGGAAAGGAILGALIGGKKGALIGAATGAGGGTAVVMAGDRNAATLPAGTVVTIRLAAPVGVEVEKR